MADDIKTLREATHVIAGINTRLTVMTSVFGVSVGLGAAAFWALDTKIDRATAVIAEVKGGSIGQTTQLVKIDEKLGEVIAVLQKQKLGTDGTSGDNANPGQAGPDNPLPRDLPGHWTLANLDLSLRTYLATLKIVPLPDDLLVKLRLPPDLERGLPKSFAEPNVEGFITLDRAHFADLPGALGKNIDPDRKFNVTLLFSNPSFAASFSNAIAKLGRS